MDLLRRVQAEQRPSFCVLSQTLLCSFIICFFFHLTLVCELFAVTSCSLIKIASRSPNPVSVQLSSCLKILQLFAVCLNWNLSNIHTVQFIGLSPKSLNLLALFTLSAIFFVEVASHACCGVSHIWICCLHPRVC